MKKYIYIGAGGFMGACLRYFIKGIVIFNYTGKFPVNTMLINITGSFVLAFFLTTAYEMVEMDEDLRLGFSVGFLGAFTTFSTMCREAGILLQNGSYFIAFAYITMSIILGMLFAFAGIILSRAIVPKFSKCSSR